MVEVYSLLGMYGAIVQGIGRLPGGGNMTKQQALTKADELIESDESVIYNVAWEHGQIVANVKEMKWFREAVAHYIMDDSN